MCCQAHLLVEADRSNPALCHPSMHKLDNDALAAERRKDLKLLEAEEKAGGGKTLIPKAMDADEADDDDADASSDEDSDEVN